MPTIFLSWFDLSNFNINYVYEYCKHEIISYTKIIKSHTSICGWSDPENYVFFKSLEGEFRIDYVDLNPGENNLQSYFYKIKENDKNLIGFTPNTWYLLTNNSDSDIEVLVLSKYNMWQKNNILKKESFILKKSGEKLIGE